VVPRFGDVVVASVEEGLEFLWREVRAFERAASLLCIQFLYDCHVEGSA